jgi:hypothetical protein
MFPPTAALIPLLRSHEYATELGRDEWDFAVEIDSLRAAGLTNGDLRWLLCKGFARHAVETSSPQAPARSFAPLGPLMLAERCCFVLTVTGAAYIRTGELPPTSDVTHTRLTLPLQLRSDGPKWDKDRRSLLFRGQLVKQFKVPAANQEIILVAFEEENWAGRIDDPLPLVPLLEPKRRLHDTINSLNRNQRSPLLRFFGDGSGEAICWEPASAVELPGQFAAAEG